MFSAFGVEDSRLDIGKADRSTRRRVGEGLGGAATVGAGVGAIRAARSVSSAADNARVRAAFERFDEGHTSGAHPLNVHERVAHAEGAAKAEHSALRLAGRAGGLRTAGALGVAGGAALSVHALRRRRRD